jgi:hypothetical protein
MLQEGIVPRLIGIDAGKNINRIQEILYFLQDSHGNAPAFPFVLDIPFIFDTI